MCNPGRRTRVRRSAGGAILIAVIGIAGLRAAAADDKKPYPVFTAEQFVAAMKTIGQAFTATNGAVTRSETEDAKAYLAISRDRLATTITFWRDRKRDDAVKMLRDTVSLMDQLDTTLSADPVDPAKTGSLAKQIGASCQACHQAYREQDPSTKSFRFKGVTE
jgi:cytochrome c556